jgi:hypothetical protein
MSKSIAVPEDFATKDHVSVEEFVSAVLANRLASREYIESRAKLFNREVFERALEEIPDVEPEDTIAYEQSCQPEPPASLGVVSRYVRWRLGHITQRHG